MKTPIEFDYDLWTTKEGKCMARVKSTGEVCEVDRETMRYLRSEEMALKRSKTGAPVIGCENKNDTKSILSLDFVSVQDAEEMSPSWLEDPYNLENTMVSKIMLHEFYLTLTQRQREIFRCCFLEEMSMSECASIKGINVTTVFESKRSIQNKAKIFFRDTPKK